MGVISAVIESGTRASMNADCTFKSEKEFQTAVLEALSDGLNGTLNPGVKTSPFLSPFAFDAAIAVKAGSETTVKFLEFKVWKGQRQGGIGFGNGKGEGGQVEVLLLPDDSLRLFETVVLWCFADLTPPEGKTRFSAMHCSAVKQAARGGVRGGKQNNFRAADVFSRRLSWDAFLGEVQSFLLSST